VKFSLLSIHKGNILSLRLIYRPLNSIGLPHYNSMLLSSWTPQFETPSFYSSAAPVIPSQVLNTMKMKDNVAYATLPRELKGKRNMVNTAPRKDQGRFRSGKSFKPDVSKYSSLGTF
jgi:hypothetical protein